ncbi:hypothetical protein CK203_109081 [Vitis vinifera]|uniref:Uncharacterized protein n=1 Tax=Vitis vinifera TaxID=29760 RepID=A0A438CBL9_VITVI|nr:hypothetical protein CK203_109081 [Vitis vinifera]
MIPGGRNFKEIERKKSGRNWSQNRAKTGEKQSSAKFRRVKETSAKLAFCCQPIPQHYRSLCECVSPIAKVDLAHECHFAEQWHQFRSCETRCEMEKRDFAPKVLFRRVFRIAKVVLAHECHFAAHAAKRVSKSEHHSRSPFVFFAKLCRPSLRSSSPFSSAGQKSIFQNGTNARGKIFIPFEPQKDLRKDPSPGSVPEPAPKPSPSRPQPSPVKPAPPKPPARRYLTRSGGRPLKKKPRVESSEPIDLTEQSPEQSPNPSPVQIPEPSPVPSPIPSPEATSVPSPVPSPTPQEKAHEPQAPIPEPQIAAEAPLEEVIRRPMLPQPPIEGNLDCRTRAFHSELCFDLAAFRVRPELAQSFQLLRRYHMEHLLAPRDFSILG